MSIPGVRQNFALDRDALHVYLWERTNRQHRVRVVKQNLADSLGVSRFTMVRVFKEMVEAGRMRVIQSEDHRIATYLVVDPAVWKAEDFARQQAENAKAEEIAKARRHHKKLPEPEPEPEPPKRRLKWG